MFSNTLKMGLMLIVIIVALLLISVIGGLISQDYFKETVTKSVMIIGVATLAFIGIAAIAKNGK